MISTATLFRHFLLLVVGSLALSGMPRPAIADELPEEELTRILERLEAILDQAAETAGGRRAIAIRAFRDASSSGEKALEFYLQCVERVRFEERGRSQNDFRAWARERRSLHGEQSFQAALVLQLRWLLFSMSSREDEEIEDEEERAAKAMERATQALSMIRELGSNWSRYAPHQEMLRQDVFSTDFARAYRIDSDEGGSVANAPLPAANVFESTIMPPLRQARRIDDLRSAWALRIDQEQREFESRGGGNQRAPARDTDRARLFRSEHRPALLWRSEMDVFRAGGQRQAAPRLMEMLEQNVNEPHALDWLRELQQAIRGQITSGGDSASSASPPTATTSGGSSPSPGTGADSTADRSWDDFVEGDVE